MKLKAEDIGFWIFILAALFIILWKLFGFPSLENTVITVGLFVVSSEFMLWRKYFDIDKKTAVSFVRLKNDIGNMSNKLDNIEKLIK